MPYRCTVASRFLHASRLRLYAPINVYPVQLTSFFSILPHSRSYPLFAPQRSRAPARCLSSAPRQRRKDLTTTTDTIYALSTAPGRAAIAIIRVSGPACLDIYGGLCPDNPFPRPRIATLRKLYDPLDPTRILDAGALVLFFPSPTTATGEDVLELHVHGGPAIVRAVLAAIPKCSNSRPRRRNAEHSFIRTAEPGEFTKRAFYNGRLDLTQAEALGETLAAETEQQRRLAIAGSGSELARRYEQWRTLLLYARGELEALIDFSEDQQFDESSVQLMQSVCSQVVGLKKQIELHLQNASRGELLRNGITVALLGAPNAGKSSLLNRIVGREAAIVSSEAGTTRDIVDVTVDVGGWLVRLGDMAGLRRDDSDLQQEITDSDRHESGSDKIGAVEQEGIRRARERALQSDAVVAILSLVKTNAQKVEFAYNAELLAALKECSKFGKTILFVVNKIDLLSADYRAESQKHLQKELSTLCPFAHPGNTFWISCKDEAAAASGSLNGNLQRFLHGLESAFTDMTAVVAGEVPSDLTAYDAQSYWTSSLSITHRQQEHLKQCLTYLEDFLRQNSQAETNAFPNTDMSPAEARLSHYVDDHEDLVGEAAYTTINQRLQTRWGQAQQQGMTSTALGPGNLPATSADTSHQLYRPHEAESEFDIVTAAEHLRYAADCLARITGRGEGGDVEDVLGVVFEK